MNTGHQVVIDTDTHLRRQAAGRETYNCAALCPARDGPEAGAGFRAVIAVALSTSTSGGRACC